MDIDPKIKIDKAIAWAGSSANLARILEIDRSNISRWQRQGLEYLPPLHGYRLRHIEIEATAAKVGAMMEKAQLGGRVN